MPGTFPSEVPHGWCGRPHCLESLPVCREFDTSDSMLGHNSDIRKPETVSSRPVRGTDGQTQKQVLRASSPSQRRPSRGCGARPGDAG